jgi:hypothetical protein
MIAQLLVGLLFLNSLLTGLAFPTADTPTWTQAYWDKTQFVAAPVEPGVTYWHVLSAEYPADTWDHTLWLYVEGRDDTTGKLPDGATVWVKNANGQVGAMPVKAPPELQNWPMYKHDILEWWLTDSLGRASDHVANIRSDYTNLPAGVNAGHIGQIFRVGRRVAPATATPTATPQPTATATAPWVTPTATSTWHIIEQSDNRIVIEK